MIDRLLPGSAFTRAEAFGDVPGRLLPAEAAVVAGAVDTRRREFSTVRVLARPGLVLLGHPSAPLLPGTDGAPRWPSGVVGSITHCEGYRAVVMAGSAEVATIGIDAEPDEPLPDGVLEVIATSRERDQGEASLAVRHWSRLLFSAKESAYKAWYPIDRRRLSHQDVEVDLAPDGTFVARRRDDGSSGNLDAPARLTGRWLRGSGLLLTAVAIRSRWGRTA